MGMGDGKRKRHCLGGGPCLGPLGGRVRWSRLRGWNRAILLYTSSRITAFPSPRSPAAGNSAAAMSRNTAQGRRLLACDSVLRARRPQIEVVKRDGLRAQPLLDLAQTVQTGKLRQQQRF